MSDQVTLVVQIALGLVFLLSAIGKMRDPMKFARGVVDYGLLPRRFAFTFAFLLIPLELQLAVSHVTGWLLAVAVPLGSLTLTVFIVAVVAILWRGRSLPCHCFGSGDEDVSIRTLSRLLVLLTAEALLIGDPKTFSGTRLIYPQQVFAVTDVGYALVLAILTVLAGSWLLSLGDVIELLKKCRPCEAPARATD